MLLGIVLHASLPYFTRLLGFEAVWPADDDQSLLLFLVFDFIHAWRMPVFFLLAGFFAHLVLERRAMSMFALDRLKRIGVPLVLFGAVMAVIIPPIWVYGWFGVMSVEVFQDSLKERRDLESSGELIAHLWFLYYLLLMYATLVGLWLLARPWRARALSYLPTLGRRIGDAVYTRIPLLLALAAVVLLIVRGGNESKPVWPLNVPDVLYGTLFFFYGYGLYARRELIDRLRGDDALVVLWSIAATAFFVHLVLLGIIDEASKSGEDPESTAFLGLLNAVFYGASAVVFSVALVGLFERILRSPRPWVRWLADSSYWIYIIHLPVVTSAYVLPRPSRQAGLVEGPDRHQLECGDEVRGGLRRDRVAGDRDVPLPGQVHAAGDAPEREEGPRISGEKLASRPAPLGAAGLVLDGHAEAGQPVPDPVRQVEAPRLPEV